MKHIKTLTEQFNTASVQKGDTFAIHLQSSPSTGHLWDVKVVSGEASRHGIGAFRPGRGIGGEGTESHVFKAEQVGTIELVAEYKRPWEEGKPAMKTQKFTVRVE